MSIIQRVPWTVQPQVPVGLDVGNPLTRDIVAISTPNLLTGSVLSGPIAQTVRPRGRSFFGSMCFEVGATYSLSNPHTAFTLFRTEGTVNALSVHTAHSTAGQNLWLGQGNGAEIYVQGGGLVNAGTYTLNRDYSIAGVYSGATIYAYVDGVQTATGSNSTSGSGKLILMALGAGSFPTLGSIALSVAWARALTSAELAAVHANPWQLFAPLPRRIWAPASAGGVSGTLAKTNANDTSAATGTTTVTGTLAKTNGSDTSAASGTTTIVGTLSKSNANDTSAASGTVGSGVSGTVAYSNVNDTSAATGTTTVTGTSAATNANDSAAASGWAGTVSGTVAVTNENDTATASGVVTQPAELTPQGGGGWLPRMRRKTRKELHADRVRLGILPPDIVKAAQKAAAVVLDEPSPVKAYRADPEAVNRVFLRELGATKMMPDYTRAIQIQIELMQQEEEEILLLL